MTGRLTILHNVRKIPKCLVILLDGRSTIAMNGGLTRLDGNLVLKNVLYVPDLSAT